MNMSCSSRSSARTAKAKPIGGKALGPTTCKPRYGRKALKARMMISLPINTSTSPWFSASRALLRLGAKST
ncbi:hypothetical protein D3C79_622560 [compost metagenome]